MKVTLQQASLLDADLIWHMQIEAFAELLAKYQDMDTNPGNEPIEKIRKGIEMLQSFFYLIKVEEEYVGAIRVVIREDGEKRISPLFVLPQYRNEGIAQRAITEVEAIHGKNLWALETILEEKGNCHLYEKMGYMDTGKREVVNDKLTLILYYK